MILFQYIPNEIDEHISYDDMYDILKSISNSDIYPSVSHYSRKDLKKIVDWRFSLKRYWDFFIKMKASGKIFIKMSDSNCSDAWGLGWIWILMSLACFYNKNVILLVYSENNIPLFETSKESNMNQNIYFTTKEDLAEKLLKIL